DLYDPRVYGPYRVFRGGGWNDLPHACRASVRRKSHPALRVDDLGFRLARTPRPSSTCVLRTASNSTPSLRQSNRPERAERRGGPVSKGMRDMLRGLPVSAGPLASFDPASAPGDPLALFRDWFAEAVEAGVPEPHAMTLATADAEGAPSARILIMKDLTEQGWWF